MQAKCCFDRVCGQALTCVRRPLLVEEREQPDAVARGDAVRGLAEEVAGGAEPEIIMQVSLGIAAVPTDGSTGTIRHPIHQNGHNNLPFASSN